MRFAIIGMACVAALSAASAADAADAALSAPIHQFIDAFNKGDAKAVAAFYAGDASFLPPTHDVILGRDGIETFFAGLFASGVTGHALELIDTSGDNAIVIAAARWSAIGRDASGKEARFSGIATHIFERQPDGSLKLKLHTFN